MRTVILLLAVYLRFSGTKTVSDLLDIFELEYDHVKDLNCDKKAGALSRVSARFKQEDACSINNCLLWTCCC